MRRTLKAFTLLFLLASFAYVLYKSNSKENQYVNVYCWYGLLDREIIKQFEDETGLKVRLDSYDNNEVLEAKLLATNSGFDVVFPSAVPYLAWQIQAGVYQKINKDFIPNYKNIRPTFLSWLKSADENLEYSLPYFWGGIGLAYDQKIIDKYIPKVDQCSLKLLFYKDYVKKIAPYGINLPEEAIDALPFTLLYLGLNPNSFSQDDLLQAGKLLYEIRPFVKHFSSSKVENNLIMGNTAISIIWSGEGQRVVKEAKEMGLEITFILPDEGASAWIDAVAIPKGAPHVENAHKFINFLLRPEIAAKIAMNTLHGVAIKNISSHLPEAERNNKFLNPDEEFLKKFFFNLPPKTKKEFKIEKYRTRLWANIRLNER